MSLIYLCVKNVIDDPHGLELPIGLRMSRAYLWTAAIECTAALGSQAEVELLITITPDSIFKRITPHVVQAISLPSLSHASSPRVTLSFLLLT